jgi:hypothetical protein
MSSNAAERLSDTEVADPVAALDDEYMATATHAQAILDFGAVRPFINIVEAQGRHAEALISLLRADGVPGPADTWPGRLARTPRRARRVKRGLWPRSRTPGCTTVCSPAPTRPTSWPPTGISGKHHRSDTWRPSVVASIVARAQTETPVGATAVGVAADGGEAGTGR